MNQNEFKQSEPSDPCDACKQEVYASDQQDFTTDQGAGRTNPKVMLCETCADNFRREHDLTLDSDMVDSDTFKKLYLWAMNQRKSIPRYCVKKGQLFLTRKSVTGPLTWTDNREFAYTYEERAEAMAVADAVGEGGMVEEFTTKPTINEKLERFTTLTNLLDVYDFFATLSEDIAWHPESQFGDYITLTDDKRLFTVEEAKRLDGLMTQSFDICEAVKLDPCELGLSITQTAQLEKPPTPQWMEEFDAQFEVHPIITALFNDISWHNDVSPSFCLDNGNDGEDFRLWVDHPDATQRECSGKRYRICSHREERQHDPVIVETDDTLEIVLAFLRIKAGMYCPFCHKINPITPETEGVQGTHQCSFCSQFYQESTTN